MRQSGSAIMQNILQELTKRGHHEIVEAAKRKIFDIPFNSEQREIAFAEMQHPVFKSIHPEIYLTLNDISKNVYLIAMADLRNVNSFTHLHGSMLDAWEDRNIQVVLSDNASFHALYYNRCDEIPENIKLTIGETNIARCYGDPRTKQLIKVTLMYHLENNKHVFDQRMAEISRKLLRNIDEICTILGKGPHTLIHNDLTIDNICLRKNPIKSIRLMCV